MAYIGPEPNPGQNREVDDISSGFNGSEVNFTLQVSSQNVSPGSSNAIIVSLGGVVQNPGTDYTVNASTLTFSTAPASGLSFFGLVLGQGVDAVEPADGSVSTVKIADQAVTLAKLPHGTGSNDGKFLRANNGADPTFETVSGTTINSNADNRVITGSGTANTLNAETVLNFDSTGQLLIGHDGSSKTAGLLAQLNIEKVDGGNLTVKRNSANEFGPFIGLGKTRATSIGGATIVQANDRLGSIGWFASDGNDTNCDAAVIRAEVDGTPGSDDMPGRLLFLTTPDGSNGSSERMRITNKGDVFIGRTSGIDTSEILGVKGHSGDHCTFGMSINGTTNSCIIGFNDDDADFRGRIQYNHNSDQMGFRVAGGNDAFQIRSDSKCFFNVVNSHVAIDKNATGTIIDFINGGNSVGTISITNSNTSYNTSSDYRLKENVVALTDAITRLKTLKPYRFNFISDKDKTVDGFLAHEVTAVPEAITGTKDEVETVYYESNDTIPEGKAIGDVKDTASPVYQGIDQSKLVPLLTAALQEAIAKIEVLETKVAALGG